MGDITNKSNQPLGLCIHQTVKKSQIRFNDYKDLKQGKAHFNEFSFTDVKSSWKACKLKCSHSGQMLEVEKVFRVNYYTGEEDQKEKGKSAEWNRKKKRFFSSMYFVLDSYLLILYCPLPFLFGSFFNWKTKALFFFWKSNQIYAQQSAVIPFLT